MKLVTIILFIATLQLSAKSYSQNARVDIRLNNGNIIDVFNEIEKQTEFRIFYKVNLINLDKKIDMAAQGVLVKDVLNDVLANTGASYDLIDRVIVITPEIVRQSQTVKGKITDSTTGEPLVGVNIVVEGTTIGTMTDIDGNYSIEVPSRDVVLVCSSIGYLTEKISVNGRSTIDLPMLPDVKNLSEVVVIGYGTQKKVNLTGSVSVATGDELANRPIASVSNGLQGLLSGVTVVNSTGLPGQSTGTIRIRGIGTTGNSNPLVLIDGVEGNINIMNPDDIESISVLKDAASASIYGARGANGVILVTTKKVNGKESKPVLNFNGNYGFQMPTRLPEMANAMEYIEMDNEARANMGLPSNYPNDAIDRIINKTDPNYYNNTNWIDAIYKKSAPQQNYTVSLTGNSPLMGYYFSYGYLNQEGLTVGSSTNAIRHNIRTKLNTRIADRLDITANIGYTKREYAVPSGGFDSDNGALYSAMRISPVIPSKFDDGGWGYGGGSANPVALLYASGQNQFSSQEVSGNFTGKLDLAKGWDVSTTYTMLNSNSIRDILSKTINYYRPGTTEVWYTTNPTNKYENRDYTSLKQTVIAQTNFEKIFNKHFVSAIAGFSQEWYVEKNFTAERTRLTTEIEPSIEFGDLTTMSNSASANDWAIRSGFGRLNYIFNDRYLFESNVRYDLSSRFPKKKRAGVFPSFSAGWKLSEESFLSGIRNLVDNLKLRASCGILGNQYVGASNYPYLAYLSDVSVPTIGTVPNLGYTQAILPNTNLTWETIHMTDVGIDASFLNNRLSLTADWFIKDTKNILLVLTYPNVLGMTPTDENAGGVRNQGWEVELKWNDNVGAFSYGASVSLADVHNEVTDLAGLEPTIGSYNIRKVGEPIGAFYGLVADGIAMPWDFQRYDPEARRYIGPKFPILSADAGLVQPGDIKYKDLGGPNGVPDGKITLDNDRTVIGSPIPRYTYDFKGNIGWKGFDLSVMLQGVGKADGYLTGAGRHAFVDQSSYPQKVHMERWTPSNPNPDASYPRFTFNSNYNQRFSTFWLEDASYLRVKNIQLGYTFNKFFSQKMKIEKCRVYVSADNLFTATNFFYAYDPETPVSSGGFYPQVKTVVMGFNVTFK